MGRARNGGSSWTDQPGIFFLEIAVDDENGDFITDDGCKISDEVAQEIKGLFPEWEKIEMFYLEINFLSSGYYDPGVLSGPPERCYPPEGSDERRVDYVTIDPASEGPGYDQKRRKRLTKTAEILFEQFWKEIQDTELPHDNDGPEFEYC